MEESWLEVALAVAQCTPWCYSNCLEMSLQKLWLDILSIHFGDHRVNYHCGQCLGTSMVNATDLFVQSLRLFGFDFAMMG